MKNDIERLLEGKEAVIFDVDGTLIDSMGVWSVSEIMLVLFRVLPAHQMLPQPSADRYRAVSHFRIIRAAARCRRILKELRTH